MKGWMLQLKHSVWTNNSDKISKYTNVSISILPPIDIEWRWKRKHIRNENLSYIRWNKTNDDTHLSMFSESHSFSYISCVREPICIRRNQFWATWNRWGEKEAWKTFEYFSVQYSRILRKIECKFKKGKICVLHRSVIFICLWHY